MKKILIIFISIFVICGVVFSLGSIFNQEKVQKTIDELSKKDDSTSVKTARIVANGDILYHDILYMSAKQEDGSYNFDPYFEYAKSWIEEADLAIGDYEGTISSKYHLSGYPLFNAPIEAAKSMKNTGYDVADLAHNHILDSGLSGIYSTVEAFKNVGIDTIGVHTDKKRSEDDILIKDVNGIKIAILGYAYGYNGLESNLTKEDYENHLSDLDEEKMKNEIEKAKKSADAVIVMPQMGVEYNLTPTEAQKELYHKMISWGADVVFGGHPHVPEPTETVEKDGEKKFIIYSMGNFISNQIGTRMKSLGVATGDWTERGVLMDVTFEKTNDKTIIKTVKAHPTLTTATPNGKKSPEGYALNDYRVMILEDFIAGGKHRDKIDTNLQEKVDKVYKETNEFLNVQW